MGTDQDASFRWALAGYGAGGRTFHRPLISSATGLELVAVVTGSPERQAQVRAELPGATPVGGLADLAALGVQGVTITTPTSTHAALAHEALDLGLHVVVDKPFALIVCKQRLGQPRGLIGVPDSPRLSKIARPENVVGRRVGTIVQEDQPRSLSERDGVPEKTRRFADDPGRPALDNGWGARSHRTRTRF